MSGMKEAHIKGNGIRSALEELWQCRNCGVVENYWGNHICKPFSDYDSKGHVPEGCLTTASEQPHRG